MMFSIWRFLYWGQKKTSCRRGHSRRRGRLWWGWISGRKNSL